ncbi:hypothetical protein Ptr902_07395 [Pyrenophora tritici-repentis]|nr:hypothetical protein Ptr902_07395 [Pyrenophora tritici-repentis]
MPTDPVDPNLSLLQARTLKNSVTALPATLIPPAQLPAPSSSDPEVQLITSLRDDKKMKWMDIAIQLNAARQDRNEAPVLNPASVYSRYILAAPMTATPVAEIGFDAKDYTYLRDPGQVLVQPGSTPTSADPSVPGSAAATSSAPGSSAAKPKAKVAVPRAGRKRVKNLENAIELKDNVRQPATAEELEELKGEARTQMLIEAVAKVERNFWTLVADEVDRVGGVKYEGKVLANRWFEL